MFQFRKIIYKYYIIIIHLHWAKNFNALAIRCVKRWAKIEFFSLRVMRNSRIAIENISIKIYLFFIDMCKISISLSACLRVMKSREQFFTRKSVVFGLNNVVLLRATITPSCFSFVHARAHVIDKNRTRTKSLESVEIDRAFSVSYGGFGIIGRMD